MPLGILGTRDIRLSLMSLQSRPSQSKLFVTRVEIKIIQSSQCLVISDDSGTTIHIQRPFISGQAEFNQQQAEQINTLLMTTVIPVTSGEHASLCFGDFKSSERLRKELSIETFFTLCRCGQVTKPN